MKDAGLTRTARGFCLNGSRGENIELFMDSLTKVYSRRYFETYRTHLEGMECVAMIDSEPF